MKKQKMRGDGVADGGKLLRMAKTSCDSTTSSGHWFAGVKEPERIDSAAGPCFPHIDHTWGPHRRRVCKEI